MTKQHVELWQNNST